MALGRYITELMYKVKILFHEKYQLLVSQKQQNRYTHLDVEQEENTT